MAERDGSTGSIGEGDCRCPTSLLCTRHPSFKQPPSTAVQHATHRRPLPGQHGPRFDPSRRQRHVSEAVVAITVAALRDGRHDIDDHNGGADELQEVGTLGVALFGGDGRSGGFVLTWSFSTDKRQRASRACEVSYMPLLCFGWNLGCAVGSLAARRPRLAGRLRPHRLSCLGSNRAPSISRIRDADQSPLPDLPCPQSTDTLSAHCSHRSTHISTFVRDIEAHVNLCRSAAMLRASAFRAPTARPSRSNVASRPRNERRCKPPRKPEIPTGTFRRPRYLLGLDPRSQGGGCGRAACRFRAVGCSPRSSTTTASWAGLPDRGTCC